MKYIKYFAYLLASIAVYNEYLLLTNNGLINMDIEFLRYNRNGCAIVSILLIVVYRRYFKNKNI